MALSGLFGLANHSSETFKFDRDRDFNKRKQEFERMRSLYSDRLPIIVEKGSQSDVPDINKHKYLVPTDLTVQQFLFVIKKQIRVNPQTALIFITKNGHMLPGSDTIANVHEKHADSDGFLKLKYYTENTFG